MSKTHENRLRECAYPGHPARTGLARRVPLAAALSLALLVDAGMVLARDAAVGIRPEALEYLAGQPLPADMSWEHKVQLEALALHYGLPSPVPDEGRATIPVTNCNDTGAGSLRNAIAAAASGDIINATGLTCSTISLGSGALVVNQNNLLIMGPGRDNLTVRSPAKYGRIIRHQGNGTLTLTGMTLSEGRISPLASENGHQGGCLFSNGSVTLGNSGSPANGTLGVHVRDCLADSRNTGVTAEGGGVFARGGLNMYASVISGCTVQASENAVDARGGGAMAGSNVNANSAINMKYSEIRDNRALGTYGNAGGVRNGSGISSTNILNSTISGNQAAGKGGGLYLTGGGASEVRISNSTISGNTAARAAGALINLATQSGVRGDIEVVATTITRNRATTYGGGAGLDVNGHLALQSTIVSGNIGPNGNGDDSDHDLGSLTGANNLVGVGSAPPSGLISSSSPGLGSLAHHGGPTRTHALLQGSPAVNTGNSAVGANTDQRGPGFPRVRDGRADIGAFERDPDAIFVDGFE